MKAKTNARQGRTFWDFASENPDVILRIAVFALLVFCIVMVSAGCASQSLGNRAVIETSFKNTQP